MSGPAKAEVDELLDALEAVGAAQTPRPLASNPLLFGNYVVAYTSIARAREQRGQRE